MTKELEKGIEDARNRYNETHVVSVHQINEIANEQYELHKHYGVEYRTWMIAFSVANEALFKK